MYSLPRVLLQYAALKDTLVSDGTTRQFQPCTRVTDTDDSRNIASHQTFFLSQNYE